MRLKLVGASVRRAVAVTMRFLALVAALALAGSTAINDYVALKALYEATGGSGWSFNGNWDMSNTSVCGWNDPSLPSYEQQMTCAAGHFALCASTYDAVVPAISPLTLAPTTRSQGPGREQLTRVRCTPSSHSVRPAHCSPLIFLFRCSTSWRQSPSSFVSRGAKRQRRGRARRPAGTPPPSATPFAASSTSMEGRSSTRLIPRTAKRGRPGALAYRPLTN